MRCLHLEITPQLAGRRVGSLLRYELQLPQSMIARLKLREGGILCNGILARTIDRVQQGDLLCVQIGDLPARRQIVPIAAELDIRWEDEDLLVLNKPAGMAVHGPNEKEGGCTVANALCAYLGPQMVFHPVNRLDRGTSGLMVVAKNGYLHDRLRRMLHSDAFCRSYLALAAGTLPEPQGSVTLPIGRDPASPIKRMVRADGSAAHTEYQVVWKGEEASLVRLWPRTGRTHQLRVHLAAMGCPLLGDWLYGAGQTGALCRPALHAAEIHLTHPLTKEPLHLVASLPDDMQAALSAFGWKG